MCCGCEGGVGSMYLRPTEWTLDAVNCINSHNLAGVSSYGKSSTFAVASKKAVRC